MDPMRVVVVDDHDLVRHGIVGLLQSQQDIEVIGQASSGWDGIELVSEVGPDVVLMDIAMPGITGLDAARELNGRFPHIGIIMLTIHDHEVYRAEAHRAGASGYVLKGADSQELLDAVRAARQDVPATRRRSQGDWEPRADVGQPAYVGNRPHLGATDDPIWPDTRPLTAEALE